MLPFGDPLGRHMFLTQVHSGHVIRRVHDEKKDKGQNIDPKE
jgi:hypothetical protein